MTTQLTAIGDLLIPLTMTQQKKEKAPAEIQSFESCARQAYLRGLETVQSLLKLFSSAA
jgi:hypothetical protein